MLKPKAPYVIAHWSLLVEDFNTSAMDFYGAVEAAVRRRETPDVEFSLVTWKEGGIASAERQYLRVQRGRLAFDICAAPFGRGFFFSSWLARVPFGNALLWLVVLGAIVFGAIFAVFVLAGLTGDAFSGCGMLFFLGPLVLGGLPLGAWLLGMAVHQGHIGDEELVLSMPVIGYLYALVFNPLAYYRIDTALMFQKTIHNAVTEVIDVLRSEQGLRALAPEDRTATIRDFAR